MKCLLILALAISAANAKTVRGYMKKNGTYVSPHIRSKADKSIYNNYSYGPGQEYKAKTRSKK
jgi:hypothetical protein